MCWARKKACGAVARRVDAVYHSRLPGKFFGEAESAGRQRGIGARGRNFAEVVGITGAVGDAAEVELSGLDDAT